MKDMGHAYYVLSIFEMKDMGHAYYVLGVKIQKDQSKIVLSLSKENFIKRILE
jgi:hypothetical protein